MNKVFVAYPFRPENQALVAHLISIISSHLLVPITGEVAAGQSLTDAVKNDIANADALVAVMTAEQELAGGGWATTDWVKTEYTTANNNNKYCIAFLETGVQPLQGLFSENEAPRFDRKSPADMLVRLSRTIKTWKDLAGRLVEIILSPPEAAKLALHPKAQCEYRFVSENGSRGVDWQKGVIRRPQNAPGSPTVMVPGFKAGYSVELQLRDGTGAIKWSSLEIPERLMHATLMPVQE